jgi:hypothetical protein
VRRASARSGKHLPRPKQSARLDAVLQTDGALRQLIAQAREAPPAVPATRASESVLDVFRRVQAAIESYLQTDDDGRPLGWCHNLQQGLAPTPVSTAFAIRILQLIDETSISRLGGLGRCLRVMEEPDGGWAARSQRRRRPEATASVLDALVRVDPGMDPSPYLDLLQKDIDGATLRHTAMLARVLETLLDLRPEADMVQQLLKRLLKNRHEDSRQRLLWGQKAEPGLANPEPSAIHTACACAVLKRASVVGAVRPDLTGKVDGALETGVAWLLRQRDLDNTSEEVERYVGGRKEVLYYRHFTSAWVLRTLLLCGVPSAHPTVAVALEYVWKSFDDQHSLFHWRNGDLPTWMTFDGISALRTASLASLTQQ